jgi:hypothetical protein
MKFSVLTLVAAAASAKAIAFRRLNLPDPQNWLPGRQLVPAYVIAGYHAEYNAYDRESWAYYVLQQCIQFQSCNTSASYSGTPVASKAKKIR